MSENSDNYLEPDQITFDRDERCQIAHFDFDAVDRGNPLAAIVNEPQPQHYELAGEALASILDWFWRMGPGNHMQSAFRKFVAVSALLRPDLLGNLNYVELAEKLGCGKATLSKVIVEFEEVVCGGIQFRTSRPKMGRENMRLARLAQVSSGKLSPWAIHKAKQAQLKA